MHYLKPFRFKYFKKLYKQNIAILDVGCGNNSAIITKKYFKKWSYHGIDRENYNSSSHNIHLIDKTSKDPEVIMKRIWKKSNIPNNNKRKQIGIRKHITDEDKKYPILFIDSGKDWATKNNLKKWKKNNVSNDLSYKKIN